MSNIYCTNTINNKNVNEMHFKSKDNFFYKFKLNYTIYIKIIFKNIIQKKTGTMIINL